MLQLCLKDSNKPPIWLVDEKYTIGSDSNCDFVVEADGVASHSADIIVTGEALSIVRRASSITLDVNGAPVPTDSPLVHGDKIHLGHAALEIVDPKLIHKNKDIAAPTDGPEWAIQAQNAALSNRRFTITGSVVLGRSKDCDICLAVSHLSRRHARLTVTSDGLEVEDLNSSNGSYVNGKRVKKHLLQAGDELSFDALSFRIICSDDDADKTSLRPALNETEFPPTVKAAANKAAKPKAQPVYKAPLPKEESLETQQSDSDQNKSQWIVLAVVLIAIGGLSWFLIV